MTVGEIESRMTTRELAEWVAYTKYFQALDDSWAETGLIVSAVLAPHCEPGRAPKASEFIPIEEPPQHEQQALDVIRELRKQLGYD